MSPPSRSKKHPTPEDVIIDFSGVFLQYSTINRQLKARAESNENKL
jgi:hypothetical protein